MAFNFDDDAIEDLNIAVENLEAASNTPARFRATKVRQIVDEICEHAYQFGLPQSALIRLLKVVTTKTELDQSSTTSIIKSLYPASQVTSAAVTVVINCLGHAKYSPSTAVQASLVQWLTAVYDVLEDQSYVLHFYSVLFNLLDMLTIRPGLCRLLATITRRKHVRPFRVQRLMELSQQAAHETALIQLLYVYKTFLPEIVLAVMSGKTYTSLPDSEWRQRLRTIQQITNSQIGSGHGTRGFRVAQDSILSMSKSAIPEIRTSRVRPDGTSLNEIQNATEFVESLEKIEIPSQVFSVLRDPLFQKYLQLEASAEAERRLDFWLTQRFEEELENIAEGFGLSATLNEILVGLVNYTEHSKALLPVVERFLHLYLPLWNGSTDLGLILDLVSFLPPQRFSELRRSLLLTLEKSIINAAEAPFEVLFEFYGNLAQKWLASNSLASTGRTPRGFLKSHALYDLLEHVYLLAESALTTGQSVASDILGFLERSAERIASQIARQKQVLAPILPRQNLVYLLSMSSSLNDLSRSCSVLVTYKRCFEKQDAGVTRIYQANATELLNGYLMDFCNMLWRSRALNTADTNASGFLCEDGVAEILQSYLTKVERDYTIHTAFDFSHNTLTAMLSQNIFLAKEEQVQGEIIEGPLHVGPVTQRSLMVLDKEGGLMLSWQDFRLQVLDSLEQYGLDGYKKLMYATMRNLMSLRT